MTSPMRGRCDRVLAEIDRNMPPLKGVFHAAGVIEDALLAKLTRERFDAVVRPKVLGAFNLHEATCERVLDWFVLYSSATTVIGNPGQASYVAANLYLEGLARYRRARGLPALAMLWGAIGKVGHLAKNPDLAKTMEERLGVMPIDPARAFDGLEQAMLSGVGEVAVAELNWTKLSRLPRIADAPKYAGFGTRRDGVDASVSLDELKGRIALVSIDEAAAMLVPIVGKQISEVMRIPAAKLDTEASLLDVGMDSMMMVELQMMMERTFGLRLPVLDLMDRATISGISRRLAEEISAGGPRPTVRRIATISISTSTRFQRKNWTKSSANCLKKSWILGHNEGRAGVDSKLMSALLAHEKREIARRMVRDREERRAKGLGRVNGAAMPDGDVRRPAAIPLRFRPPSQRDRAMARSNGAEHAYFRVHDGIAADTTVIDGRAYLNFTNYNYLGLSGHPVVAAAVADAVARYGTSVSASRMVGGERPLHRELEASLRRDPRRRRLPRLRQRLFHQYLHAQLSVRPEGPDPVRRADPQQRHGRGHAVWRAAHRLPPQRLAGGRRLCWPVIAANTSAW